MTDAGGRLSAYNDCNEQLAVAAGQIIVWMLVLFLCEDTEENVVI